MLKLPEKELLRVDEVAKYLSVSKKAIYSWIESGILEGAKVRKMIRVRRESVKKMIIPIE